MIVDADSACSVDIYTSKPVTPPPRAIYEVPEDSEMNECIYGQPTVVKSSKTLQNIAIRMFLFTLIAVVSLFFSLLLAHQTLGLGIPHTLSEMKEFAIQLETISQETWTGYLHVVFVFAVLYLWQQAFSIPGSVLLNLLGGYLYGSFAGSLWTSLLTAGGATLAYLLALLVSEPFLDLNWVASRMEVIRTQVNDNKKAGGLFWWLLFARLFPFTPYWFMNMSAPLLDIPVMPFFMSTFLGSLPYNFICCQAGEVIGQITSTADIVSMSMILKMAFISLISLIPVVFGSQIKRYMSRRLAIKTDNMDLEYQRLPQRSA
ncbi:hypothetical protein NQZ79_g1253 [Umbelopsis isabellina]|nr:hypothetical protein NQZ79_g1253 [Umbelopsis isabellina]